MKRMIYRDGKFINVISDIDPDTLYGDITLNKKSREKLKSEKNKKPNKIKKIRIILDED